MIVAPAVLLLSLGPARGQSPLCSEPDQVGLVGGSDADWASYGYELALPGATSRMGGIAVTARPDIGQIFLVEFDFGIGSAHGAMHELIELRSGESTTVYVDVRPFLDLDPAQRTTLTTVTARVSAVDRRGVTQDSMLLPPRALAILPDGWIEWLDADAVDIHYPLGIVDPRVRASVEAAALAEDAVLAGVGVIAGTPGALTEEAP